MFTYYQQIRLFFALAFELASDREYLYFYLFNPQYMRVFLKL